MKLVSTDNAETAIRTLMIGSIDRIERYMGHLWGHMKAEGEETTPEEDEIYELFMELRESILDFGQDQICKIRGQKWKKK